MKNGTNAINIGIRNIGVTKSFRQMNKAINISEKTDMAITMSGTKSKV